ncbi:MAG: 16S rRNA (guanine(527)-N(7))-methyltransferase RsmG [Mucilaginibacter polytrichastri]|nr:16S rRNA (guanine(527)-N(7))-methyltransferase RsmG [Mucilaginibacter polytrichastri]
MRSEIITTYFPEVSTQQQEHFAQLGELYAHWNSQINVVSRKDIDELYERHVLHSLGIAKVYAFQAGQQVLDVGTGGGFPGIPLAILFPQTEFLLVDSIGKKITVVKEVASALGLKNVRAKQERAENVKQKNHFVVSRAVTRLKDFWPWIRNSFHKKSTPGGLQNGLLYLKGGDLADEISESGLFVQKFPLNHYFKEPFFDTKQVIYVPAP